MARDIDALTRRPAVGRAGAFRAGISRVSRDLLEDERSCSVCGAPALVQTRHGSTGWKWFCALHVGERNPT